MSKKLPRLLKCVLIDWDGTLVTAEPMVHEAYVRTFKSLKDNRIWMPIDTHGKNGEDSNVIFADVDLWKGKEKQAERLFYAHYRKVCKQHPELMHVMPGAKEFISFLKEEYPDVKIVLLAAKKESLLIEELKKFGFDGLFDAVVGKTDEGPNKPDKEVSNRAFLAVSLSISDPKQEVLHVGDNPQKDESFAQKIGATSIVLHDSQPIKTFSQLKDEISIAHTLTKSLPFFLRQNEFVRE